MSRELLIPPIIVLFDRLSVEIALRLESKFPVNFCREFSNNDSFILRALLVCRADPKKEALVIGLDFQKESDQLRINADACLEETGFVLADSSWQIPDLVSFETLLPKIEDFFLQNIDTIVQQLKELK
jgi:hypothetical protein